MRLCTSLADFRAAPSGEVWFPGFNARSARDLLEAGANAVAEPVLGTLVLPAEASAAGDRRFLVSKYGTVRADTGFYASGADFAEQLGVTHVLEGSVRRVEGRVRVMATLVDGRTGYHEWSRSFERPAANLLRLPTDIAGSAASALRLVLVGNAGVGGSRLGTRNPTAYDYYMLGQQRAAERTGFGLAEAERYFQQALEADAQFAAAYAALADVHVAEFYYANRPRSEAFELATPSLERALELDAKFGFARALQGLIALELGDYPRAAEELPSGCSCAKRSEDPALARRRVVCTRPARAGARGVRPRPRTRSAHPARCAPGGENSARPVAPDSAVRGRRRRFPRDR